MRRGSGRILAAGGILLAVLFAYGVWKYYFLGDDAFISFRYALHLAEGRGLVYNLGERVEGYTNFSWVILLSAFMRMGLPPEIVSNVIGIVAGAGILWLLVRLGARTAGWDDPWIWIAPLALALNRTFTAWSTGGLETQFFSLLVLAALIRFAGERSRGGPPWGSALLFAAAAWTRPEGLLFFGVAALTFCWESLARRRRPVRSLVLWLAVFAVPVGAHILWRHAYYGWWLPNTFYAKVSGFWPAQGWEYLKLFLGDHRFWWLLPLVPLAVILKPDFLNVLFLLALVIYSAYVLAVGGDRFEFRFMAVVLPYLFWLFQAAVAEAVRRWAGKPVPRGVMLGAGVLVGLLIVGAAWLPNRLDYKEREGVTHLKAIERYAARRAGEGRFLRSLVEKGYLTGDEWLAVSGAGALPYYSRLPVVDVLGLNDVRIAHMEIPEHGRIAHEKWAPIEYLQERGVVMYDVLNGIVRPENLPTVGTRRMQGEHYSGPLRSVRAEGRTLIFATTLDDAEFQRVFARFEILY